MCMVAKQGIIDLKHVSVLLIKNVKALFQNQI